MTDYLITAAVFLGIATVGTLDHPDGWKRWLLLVGSMLTLYVIVRLAGYVGSYVGNREKHGKHLPDYERILGSNEWIRLVSVEVDSKKAAK